MPEPAVSEALQQVATPDQQLAEQLNRVGERCQAVGLQLAYHNHDFEFAVIDNTTPYEILLTQTDATLVKMEIDLYWAAKMQVAAPMPRLPPVTKTTLRIS